MLIDGISSSMPPGVKLPSTTEISNEIIFAKDTNSDGALSIEESGLTQETFDVLDTNEDGVVSQDELVSSLTEKLEALKEKLDTDKTRPAPPPMGPPPGESTEETEELTDIERLVEMFNEVGSYMTDSTQSGKDMYTVVLEELGVDGQDQNAFFEILENNGIDYEA